MTDFERGPAGGTRRGDMAVDTTQTYVRLAEQRRPTADTDSTSASTDAADRPTGLKKLLHAIWPFGRK